MKHIILFSIVFFLTAMAAKADSTRIVVHKDNRIEALATKQTKVNNAPAPTNFSGHAKGYRIMVLNTNDRELAYKTKGQLLSRFPQHAVYMSYQAPFFKLKIGDFLTSTDAADLRKKLANMMPKGVFVVSEMIVVKPTDEAKVK